MDPVSSLETALGAELLRADLLGAPRPRVVERYVVERFLGRGATGLVVAAHDETLARQVALKLSPAGADASVAEEARALARLDHPNVVRIFDAVTADLVLGGEPFRVWAVSMQLVEGVTMRAWLREAKRSPEEIVRVMRDAGAGLAAAHAQRIVHRDFKPENVLIRSDGVAQVIDFGFAVAQRSSLGVPPAEVAGTAPYLAPEARLGHATPRSDQYAFGVTLIEALTGDPSSSEAAAPAGVPTQVWKTARRARAERAADRYPDMPSVLVDLVRASKVPNWAIAALSVLALAAVVVATSLAWPAPVARPAVESPALEPARVAPPAPEPIDAPRLDVPDAPIDCGAIVGTWYVTTRITERYRADAPPLGTAGYYALDLAEGERCTFAVRLVRTGDSVREVYSNEPRDYSPGTRVRARSDESGMLWFDFIHPGRGRRFHIGLDGRGGTGTVEAPDFMDAIIESVSRFAPVAGRDLRSPR